MRPIKSHPGFYMPEPCVLEARIGNYYDSGLLVYTPARASGKAFCICEFCCFSDGTIQLNKGSERPSQSRLARRTWYS